MTRMGASRTTFLNFVVMVVSGFLAVMVAAGSLLQIDEMSISIKPSFSSVLLPCLLHGCAGCMVLFPSISSQGRSMVSNDFNNSGDRLIRLGVSADEHLLFTPLRPLSIWGTGARSRCEASSRGGEATGLAFSSAEGPAIRLVLPSYMAAAPSPSAAERLRQEGLPEMTAKQGQGEGKVEPDRLAVVVAAAGPWRSGRRRVDLRPLLADSFGVPIVVAPVIPGGTHPLCFGACLCNALRMQACSASFLVQHGDTCLQSLKRQEHPSVSSSLDGVQMLVFIFDTDGCGSIFLEHQQCIGSILFYPMI